MNKILLDIARYGNPTLSLSNGRWRCGLLVDIATTAAKFEVQEEGVSPEDAADRCHSAMIRALEDLSQIKLDQTLSLE